MDEEIPDYYRDLVDGDDDGNASGATGTGDADASASSVDDTTSSPYRADAFQLQYPGDDWQDGSTYTLAGPTIDGVEHRITINVSEEVAANSVDDFAAQELAQVETQLDGFRLLIESPITLDCGVPAYRAIFCWSPETDRTLYQEQIYVLRDDRGYTLTAAAFTRATRKRLGEDVERMMLSFTPTDVVRGD